MFLLIIMAEVKEAGLKHFNTSHVSINPFDRLADGLPSEFQYISCFY